MVGSGAAGGGGGDHARSKEAAGMMALHEALRNVCLNSDWTYSVFWTIRPRPYVPDVSFSLSLRLVATSTSLASSVPSGPDTNQLVLAIVFRCFIRSCYHVSVYIS